MHTTTVGNMHRKWLNNFEDTNALLSLELDINMN